VINITISESLRTVLHDLGHIDGIQASALVSNEGLMMESNINTHNVDTKTYGAVIAMLTRSAIHTAKELNKPDI
jgi:predicted regulator of Ras-like GTPase activity (Roadblock/LC7/MglB family)